MKVGDMVKLKSDNSSNFEIAVILMFEPVVGGIKLDRKVAGFMYWNKEDLAVVATVESRIRSKKALYNPFN